VATLPGVKAHPFIFGIAGGGVSVGRNLGQPVSTSYQAPFEFTGGTITKVVIDVSGAPYTDAEKQLALAFAKD
jgi:arylsulfatase